MPLIALLFLPACKPKDVQVLLEPSLALASVLAEETVRIVGSKKKVTLITPDTSWGPVSTAEEALRAALKKDGITVACTKAADLGDPMLSGRQVGLKAADFFDALDKSAGAGAVISLVGAPQLRAADTARLRPDHPPVLVVATASLGNKMGVRSDPMQLVRLLEAKVIDLAIIDGADPSVPTAAQADATHQLFAQNYRILRRPD